MTIIVVISKCSFFLLQSSHLFFWMLSVFLFIFLLFSLLLCIYSLSPPYAIEFFLHVFHYTGLVCYVSKGEREVQKMIMLIVGKMMIERTTGENFNIDDDAFLVLS